MPAALFHAPSVSLIIPAHHPSPMLEACLSGVAALDPVPLETILVIDGDSAEIAESAKSKGFQVVTLPHAPGVSAARNAGAQNASGRYLLFLDSDVLAPLDFVARALASLRTLPGAVAAFGSYDDSPAAPGLVSTYRNLLHHFTHQNGRREAGTFWAACGICDADIFRKDGGFDESYRKPCIEDIAFGYKLRRAGHRIALDPTWQVKHLKKWTWRDLVTTDIGRRAIPWTLLLLREERLDNDLNIDTRSRTSAILAILAIASIATAIFFPWMLALSGACVAMVIFLNRSFYQFLRRKKGTGFVLAAMPLHFFYFLAAGFGYAAGLLIHNCSLWRNAVQGK